MIRIPGGVDTMPVGPVVGTDPTAGTIATPDTPTPVDTGFLSAQPLNLQPSVPDAPTIPADSGGGTTNGMRSIAPRSGIGGTGNVDTGGGGEASYLYPFQATTTDPSANNPANTGQPIDWQQFLAGISAPAPPPAPTNIGTATVPSPSDPTGSGAPSSALGALASSLAGALAAPTTAAPATPAAATVPVTPAPTTSKTGLLLLAVVVGGIGWLLVHGYKSGWFKSLGLGK